MRRAARWTSTELTHDQLVMTTVNYLCALGYIAFPTHGPRNPPIIPGIPDVLAFKRGRQNLAVEIKRGKDMPSPDQIRVHSRLKAEGFRVLVARSIDEITEAVKT